MTSFERSYPARGMGAAALARLWVLAAALFVVGTNAFVIAGVLPDLAEGLRTSTASVATAITWYAAVVALASPLVATFLAVVPRRGLLTTGMALVAIGTAVTAVAGNVDVFIVGRVVAALGGAALVPPATAAAPTLVEPHHRGRAIAIVTAGFAGAIAFGSPLGAAVAAGIGWRAALVGIAVLAGLLAVTLGLTMTGIPGAAARSLRERFSILADRRILLALVAMVSYMVSFNVLYVFTSEVLAPVVGGRPGVLAVVLLSFGLATLVGTWLGGIAVDRRSGVWATVLGLIAMAAVYAALSVSTQSLPGAILLYAVWGLVAIAPQIGIQAVLVTANPAEVGVSLSWYSTATYVGIAVAPVLGAGALHLGAWAVLLAAGVAALVALALVAVSTQTGERQSAA
ncbi:MFS transporter [Curtobacterium sp. MCPF17_031]|uniref:MFS transporter n=1 Tax=Curtobacterium sp. MCPF17_031 TaxID=2175653 RepID=UPI000DA79556|nr:MFS transporter [Curtobacterium sp. MCPF17_031]PZE34105.1 MFS transporter [Curtobacterium sp. MCPF17_031]